MPQAFTDEHKVGCSNPSNDRPMSLKKEAISPLPYTRHYDDDEEEEEEEEEDG